LIEQKIKKIVFYLIESVSQPI